MDIKAFEDLDIEALLGRKSICSMHAPCENIRGKTVLVTGGGGSIGSEICRQVAALEPRKLIIFDISENNIYSLINDLCVNFPAVDAETVVGSVRDEKRVIDVFEQFAPDTVFHAAAHKHVPLMEAAPGEAVKNNIFGTFNVACAAKRYGAESFILISTDKAVNPTSVMGATKRVCELLVSALADEESTRFGCVRFGNVLGSSGSVIPLFLAQIKRGGPVTVTHSDIIRYFMSIPEAVSLVLQAERYAKRGEIFVLDMGAPVRIDDLARSLIKICGYEPDKDIKIQYTGLRPGEKLYEELLLAGEGLRRTGNELIYVGAPTPTDMDEVEVFLEELRRACDTSPDAVRRALKNAVPEYKCNNDIETVVP